jgi:hypothetical protein
LTPGILGKLDGHVDLANLAALQLLVHYREILANRITDVL